MVSTFSGTEHIGAWDGGVSDVVVATHLEAVTTTEAHTWLEKEGGRNVYIGGIYIYIYCVLSQGYPSFPFQVFRCSFLGSSSNP